MPSPLTNVQKRMLILEHLRPAFEAFNARLERQGLQAWAALGVPARALPRCGKRSAPQARARTVSQLPSGWLLLS